MRRRTQREGKRRYERRLVAFVVRPDEQVARIELGPLSAITDYIDSWRRKFGATSADMAVDPGQELRRLVWEKLEPHLAGIKTVLLSPDGDTARFPWPALPGKQPGTYLIDETAIAIVPIPRLLPELMAAAEPAANETPSLLLVGGVDFGADPGRIGRRGARPRRCPRRSTTAMETAARNDCRSGRRQNGLRTAIPPACSAGIDRRGRHRRFCARRNEQVPLSAFLHARILRATRTEVGHQRQRQPESGDDRRTYHAARRSPASIPTCSRASCSLGLIGRRRTVRRTESLLLWRCPDWILATSIWPRCRLATLASGKPPEARDFLACNALSNSPEPRPPWPAYGRCRIGPRNC